MKQTMYVLVRTYILSLGGSFSACFFCLLSDLHLLLCEVDLIQFDSVPAIGYLVRKAGVSYNIIIRFKYFLSDYVKYSLNFI